jgi:uncharacterized protein YfaT (DUF1175 family)
VIGLARYLAVVAGAAALGPKEGPRLDTPADRTAFVRWFTFLAEIQYFQRPEDLPREVSDCAGLIRFAYREALKAHDGAWAAELRLPLVPPIPPVSKYRYPLWPLGTNLFRVSGDRWAQFADARTLCRYNTHFISRRIEDARPGDLLFFEQAGQRLPFHAMIYLGRSQVEPGPGEWAIYHTGPSGGDRGEIRRPSLGELLEHPLPQWRPLAGNTNFLGVYRWNLLREGH